MRIAYPLGQLPDPLGRRLSLLRIARLREFSDRLLQGQRGGVPENPRQRSDMCVLGRKRVKTVRPVDGEFHQLS